MVEAIEVQLTPRLEADVKEALGNATAHGMAEICHEVLCGCPQCTGMAKCLKEYFEFPELPNKDMARNVLTVMEPRR